MNNIDRGQVEQGPALTPTERAVTWAPPTNFHAQVEAELGYLRKIGRRWYLEPANAEDLVQDTILLALDNAHQWQPGSSLRAWLFTIMRNRFFAAAARSRRSVEALDTICVAAIGGSVEKQRPEIRLMMRDLERAMLRLSSEQRMAIRLIGIEGRSYDETARLMGISVAAVRCHLSRARERLRGMVQGEEPLYRARRAAAHSGGTVAVLAEA